jgi:threonine dehydrogenase-like Zn-dependent dehydrogenase
LKTKAVRLYGVNDLRLEEFQLPDINNDEILAKVVSDSICMSSYKATIQGKNHKRVPTDIETNPIIIGHEFCGEIIKVGTKWKHKFNAGTKFTIQPALNQVDDPFAAPGYSFKYLGGNATYIIIPNVVMEQNCLLSYDNDSYFYGSLAEPMSCIVGAFYASYHTTQGSYIHKMGIAEGGNMAIVAGAGPMGLGSIDYAIHGNIKPRLLIVTDIDEERLNRASSIFTVEEALKNNVKLVYINTSQVQNPVEELLKYTDNKGFDDVMVFAALKQTIELADNILAKNGCLNFFAGPSDPEFKSELNFYNIHYNSTHVVGTSGGNTNDLIEAIDLMSKGVINPSCMITHIGGLDSVVETTLNLPKIPGGKKLIYTNIQMPLTAISDFKEKGKTNSLFDKLSKIVESNNKIWSGEAEKYLLSHAPEIRI